MFILKKGHQPGVYVPLRALFLVIEEISTISNTLGAPCMSVDTDQQSSVIIT